MPPAARMTDMHVCPMVTGVVPHVGGPILPPCCPTVLIGMLPAARITDMATCVGPPDMIAMGSPTVLIGNLMAARIGDPTIHGGVIVLGCFTVMIGEAGAPSPSAPSAPMAPSLPSPPSVAAPQGPAPSGGTASPPSPAALKPLTLEEYKASLAVIAAKDGDHPLQLAARRTIAEDFYKENCPDMSPAKIRDHLRGIDFTKPVKVVQVPPPDQFYRWGRPGSKGQYFTDDKSARPTDLGVPDPVPVTGPDGKVTKVPLVKTPVSPAGPMKCLNSTAAPIRVDWVDPPVQTKGGKPQYFIRQNAQNWKRS